MRYSSPFALAVGQKPRRDALRLKEPARHGRVEESNQEIVMPRELVEPHKGDKRYVRRGKKGQFTSRQTNVGSSLAADRRSKAKTTVKKGEGDRGDQRSD